MLNIALKMDSQMTSFHIIFKIFHLLISEMHFSKKFTQPYILQYLKSVSTYDTERKSILDRIIKMFWATVIQVFH